MAKSPECLFVWTKTNSLMGEDKWPFYGSLAVATYAEMVGAGVQIIDRRQQTKQEDFEYQVKNSAFCNPTHSIFPLKLIGRTECKYHL